MHAGTALRERDISFHWVARVLAQPAWTEPDPRAGVRRAFGRIAERGDRILRVVYIPEQDEQRVITAFFDRDAERKRKRRRASSLRP
jgi:hypothetical protein